LKYKHLFFDLDRTLWDYDTNSSLALGKVYSEFELGEHFSSSEEFISLYNHHNDFLWDQYRQGKIKKMELRMKRFLLTLQEKNINNRELSEVIGDRYMYITPRLNKLAPNTIETMEYLTSLNYKLYILTNGFLSTQEKKMASSEIDRYFIKIYSSEELGMSKPRKEIFHWAVSAVHAHKNECLMIGDDLEVDVRGAMNYGIDAVWYNPDNLSSDFNPTHTISDIGELIGIL
jgi:putative hydrolase of the HAD superfamily